MSRFVTIIDGMNECAAPDLMTWAQALILGEGVLKVGSNLLEVTESAVPAMSVLVQPGTCFVLRDAYNDDDNTLKFWNVVVTAEETVNIDSNSSGSTRIDAICVKIDTAASPDDTASNIATLVAVKGTPGAGNPTIPDSHLLLAYVSVEDGETTILNADITDSRVYVGILDEDAMNSNSTIALATQQSIKAYTDNNTAKNNLIINGNMDVWQRGTTFTAASTPANNDDTFLIDRWNLLSDGNDIIDVSRSTDKPDGSTYSAKFLVATANKKFGIVYLMEYKDARKLYNKNVSLSFQAKTTAGKLIENLRATILTWGGAVDVVTSDVVSAWNAEGANPTWAANWTAENIAADIPITASWAKHSVENIAVDTSLNNIAIVIWVDDTDASLADELFITQVQLNEGAVAIPFQPKNFEDELRACKRYYQQSYNYGVFAGAATAISCLGQMNSDNDNNKYISHSFMTEPELRATPSITAYDLAGNSGKISTLVAAGTKIDNISPSSGFENPGTRHQRMTHQGTIAGIRYHYVVVAEL